jgi:hypothetical protein
MNKATESLIPLVYDAEDSDPETAFNPEIALAILLIEDVIFLNDHWWMEKEAGWSKDCCKMTSLNVNISDVFAWGVADAEAITFSELQSVYDHWIKDQSDGVIVWVCKKHKMMPQKPVADGIRREGRWDLDSMGLNPNPTDRHFM